MSYNIKTDAELLMEYLSEIRREYIILQEENASLKIAKKLLLESNRKIMKKAEECAKASIEKKKLYLNALKNERSQFENQQHILTTQIDNLNIEKKKCIATNEELELIIEQKNIKISDLENEKKALENEIEILKARFQEVNENLLKVSRKQPSQVSQGIQVEIEELTKKIENGNDYIHKHQYLERLSYLEKIHQSEISKNLEEIERLRDLLKQRKSTTLKKSRPSNVPGVSRYPDLSEIITKKSQPSEFKKRKLYFDNSQDCVDLL